MGHILIFLHKIIGFKLLAILLSVVMVVVVFEFSSAFKVHALNVHTEIKANPPGIAKIIDRTGNPPSGIVNPTGAQPPLPTSGSEPNTSGTGLPGEPPPDGNGNNGPGGTPGKGNSQSQTGFIPPGIGNALGGGGAGALGGAGSSGGYSGPALIINTLIDFGMMFPGESLSGNFTVTIHPPYTWVNYELNTTIGDPFSSENMTPYLTIELDDDEVTAGETDTVNYATVNSTDFSDVWWVTFLVPNEPPAFGAYSANITIEVITATSNNNG